MPSQHLIGVALEQLVSGATAAVDQFGAPGFGSARSALTPVLGFLKSRFVDQSAALTTALEAATDRAWRALELVLGGESVWDRLKGALAAADMKAFRHDVRGLLAAAGVTGEFPVDRRAAARELRAARAAGALRPTDLTPAGMVDSVGVFARFSDPAELAAAQWRATDAVAADLKARGYPALAAVAAFRPRADATPLLGVAVRYFFRKAVEQDAELARGLSFARMEGLAEAQRERFAALDRLLGEQAERLDAALGELAADVAEVKSVALDIRAEQERLGNQNRHLLEAVLAIQARLDLAGRATARAQDSLSIRSDGERELVREVIARYRALPAAERAARPALRNAVGLLEVAAGDFAAARTDFEAVAEAVDDAKAKGVAHLNAYRAALEARDWAGALRELLSAARCDAARLSPFPLGRYMPQRILGAGGFGVAFLCKHKYMNAQIVVKTLSGWGGEPNFDAVFAEAQAAAAVSHPGIVRVTDCGYVDPAAKSRAFVVMEYFPGRSLDQYVREEGVIPADRLVPLARDLADALGAAHGKGIVHRDVKPGNVLVKPSGDGFEVRVIDFGLAVRHRGAESGASTSRSSRTLMGESIAGTVDYAAPEQMGRGGKVGPYSDVYGWAKTCCFALFQTAQPTLRHWQSLPAGLAQLLGRCLEEDPKHRPESFAEVIRVLNAVGPSAAPDAPTVGTPVPRPGPVLTAEVVEGVASRRARLREIDEDIDDEADGRDRRARGRKGSRSKNRSGVNWLPILVVGGVFVLVALVGVIALFPQKKTEVAQNSSGPSEYPGSFGTPAAIPPSTPPGTPPGHSAGPPSGPSEYPGTFGAPAGLPKPSEPVAVAPRRQSGPLQPLPERPPAGFVRAQVPPAATEFDGLVAYWSFDEGEGDKAADSVSKSAGTLSASRWVPGVRGKAIELSGTKSGFFPGPEAKLNVADQAPFTVAVWVRTNAPGGTVFGVRSDNEKGPWKNLTMLTIWLEKDQPRAWIRTDGGMFYPKALEGKSDLVPGEWHHLALMRHPDTTMELFADGKSVEHQGPARETAGPLTTQLRALGMEPKQPEERWKPLAGAFDEFCVFDRALEPAEIARLAGRAP